MAKKLDSRSKNILNFRPKIDFVEPPQEEVAPEGLPPGPQPIDAKDQARELKALADAVDVLAAAVQAKIDRKAKDIKIKLDPEADAAVIQALKREFDLEPVTREDEDGLPEEEVFITYDQYKHCRDHIRAHGDEIALQAVFDDNEVQAAKEAMLSDRPVTIGGLNTPEARDGRLRPELSKRAQIVKPINLGKFQNYLIRILVNYIWKKYIKPIAFGGIPRIHGVGKLSDMLPDELAKIPSSFKKQLKKSKKSGVQVL